MNKKKYERAEKAYAKINILLDVVGKREDGYHDLVSIMQSVSLYDDVSVSIETSTHKTCGGDNIEIIVEYSDELAQQWCQNSNQGCHDYGHTDCQKNSKGDCHQKRHTDNQKNDKGDSHQKGHSDNMKNDKGDSHQKGHSDNMKNDKGDGHQKGHSDNMKNGNKANHGGGCTDNLQNRRQGNLQYDIIPTGSTNTAYVAAKLFRESFLHSNCDNNAKNLLADGRIKILIHKRIPSAAGLGGGSSDAAAVLRALWYIFEPSARTALGKTIFQERSRQYADGPYEGHSDGLSGRHDDGPYEGHSDGLSGRYDDGPYEGHSDGLSGRYDDGPYEGHSDGHPQGRPVMTDSDKAFPSELYDLALMVGADVPFCLSGGTVLAEGIGEVLTPLTGLDPDIEIVLAKPVVNATTHFIFDSLDLKSIQNTAEKRKHNINRIVEAIEARKPHTAYGMLFNALEDVTIKMYPEIQEIKTKLIDLGASQALMSGSGSAVFAIFCAGEDKLPKEPLASTVATDISVATDKVAGAAATAGAGAAATAGVAATAGAGAAAAIIDEPCSGASEWSSAKQAVEVMRSSGYWACLCNPVNWDIIRSSDLYSARADIESAPTSDL